MRDRTAESRIRFSVDARALPRGMVASVVSVVEGFDFLVLELEATGVVGLRFEPEAAFVVEAGMMMWISADNAEEEMVDTGQCVGGGAKQHEKNF